MSKDKGLNLEDFKLENVLDPEYKPQGLVEEPVIEPTKNEEVPPTKDPEEEIQEDDGEEVESEEAGKVDTPDEVPEIDFKPFYNLFHERLGWEVSEEDMPENSIDGLVEYMNSIVEASSKPQYSSELVEQFDKYVANGGDPSSFMATMFGTKDYTKVTLDSESEKRNVLREYLSRTNPEKDVNWIDRKISRYEDSGVFDDEASDALEELKSIQAKEKASLVQRQEEANRQRIEEYNAQLKELENSILTRKEIAKIPVTEKETRSFADFMLKKGKDGMTGYEKVIQDKDAAINMAYFAFKGFDLSSLKANVKSEVVKDLKKSLSKFSSSTAGLQSKTGLPAKSNKIDYNDFNLNL